VVYFQDSEIEAGWEAIFDSKDYALKKKDIADNYPDKRSLFISYKDIDEYSTDMAMFVLEHPGKTIELGRKVLKERMPPDWDQDFNVNLRITELPRDARVEIRNLRAKHLGKLISVEGLVRKATTVKPRMTDALFRCARCDTEMWVPQSRAEVTEPTMCKRSGASCNTKGGTTFILEYTKSKYVDTQKVEIQESPEGLRGGAQPEKLTGFLEDDLAGMVFPGNRIILNGILKSLQKSERERSTIFEMYLDIVSIEFEQHEYDEIQITEADETEIKKMSKDPHLFDNIIKSISPTIYGLEREKEALALQLFGGSHKEMDDGTVIRGDMHILLVGDPGVAKSQLLRYMGDKLAPRGIYASGKSASAAGLCVHGSTILNAESGDISIEEFVMSRMTRPEEYREGIWRQPVVGEKILSMDEAGMMRILPVTHVWKIRTPERLVEIITESGERLILTPETKIFARSETGFGWIEAKDLRKGGMVAVSQEQSGGRMRFSVLRSAEHLTEGLPAFVYDLTVEPAHSFIGNGFVVHNTAAAVKDEFGDGRWTLEAGALVLADKGLACVDELDKMSQQDRSSLHEAMESQKISVAKAGITATLQCRCSMLAAANPKHGRFEEKASIADQIDLPPALLSRFDMIFVLTDVPEAAKDKNIAGHILKAHRRGQVRGNEKADPKLVEKILKETGDIKPVYSVDIMRKYVAYSKRITPVMSEESMNMIQESYLQTRKMGEAKGASVPITARQLEAFVRLSEASARARLSLTVEKKDAERAVSLVNYYLEKIVGAGGAMDIDSIMTGVTKRDRDLMPLIFNILREGGADGLSQEEIIRIAEGQGIDSGKTKELLDKMKGSNDIYKPPNGNYKLVE